MIWVEGRATFEKEDADADQRITASLWDGDHPGKEVLLALDETQGWSAPDRRVVAKIPVLSGG